MNRRTFIYTAFVSMLGMMFRIRPALANKSSVQIEVPETASLGQKITIKLHVSHDGNNFIHHTDWLYVKINNEEIKRWTFGMFDTPESENFTREIQHTVTGPMTVAAEADCNLHGSTGVAETQIRIQ